MSHICSRMIHQKSLTACLHFFPYVAFTLNCLLPSAQEKPGTVKYRVPLPSTENTHEETTPQHRSCSLLVRNRSKSRQKCPFRQTFHKITVKTAVCFLPSCFISDFFSSKFFPRCCFFSEVSLGSVAQLLSGRTPKLAAPASCLLVPALLVAAPIPLLLGFFLVWVVFFFPPSLT